MNSDTDIIEKYLNGEIINPYEHLPSELERLADFLGLDPDEL